MRKCLLAVLLLIATPAFAFRGRPVSDLTYDQLLPRVMDVAAASDGRDFLAVLVDGDYTDPRVYAQLVGAHGPKAPAFFVGRGGAAQVAWDGSAYLLALEADAGLQVARVSASGALVEAPRTIAPRGHRDLRVAANGGRVLIAAVRDADFSITGWLFERGRLVDGPFTIVTQLREYDLVATASGFALAVFGSELKLLRLDRDGRASGAAVTVDGPFVGNGVFSRFRGTLAATRDELAVVYTMSVYERETRVMFARIGAGGEVLQAPRLVRSVPYPQSFAVGPVAGDGSGFAVAAATGRDTIYRRGEIDPALMRLGGDGTLRELTPLSGDPLEEVPTAFVANGAGEHFIAWTRGHFDDPHLPRAAVIRGRDVTPMALGRASAEQDRPAIASSRGEYLVAWRERAGDGWQDRATRVDRNGRYRDGRGIVVAETWAWSIDVATDGANWLVVWSAGAAYARPITQAGEPGAAIELGPAWGAAVEWGSDRYLVALQTDDAIVTRTIGADGVASPVLATVATASGKGTEEDPQILYDGVAVAFDGREFQLVCLRLTTGYYRTVSPLQFNFRATAFQRIDTHGLPVGKLAILPVETFYPPRIATNGRQTLVLAGGALLLANGSVRAVRVPYAFPRRWSPAGRDVIADGSDFLVVQEDRDAKLTLARVSAAGGVSDIRTLDGHHELPALAGDTGSAAMLATTERDPLFDDVPRVAIAFVSELGFRDPQQPVVTSSRIGEDDVEVTWLPLSDAATSGVVVEVELEPDVWRVVGLALASAGHAHLPLHGLEPSRLRIRAW
ncbi:MAG TPA: hypothetical protein VF698_06550 [Thermoanaerobaculia bacterium]